MFDALGPHLSSDLLGPTCLFVGSAVSLAVGTYYNYTGSVSCYDYRSAVNKDTEIVDDLWGYQYCTEMFMISAKDNGKYTFGCHT